MRRESLCCCELAIVAWARRCSRRRALTILVHSPPALRYVDLHHAARAAAALLSLQLGLELHHVAVRVRALMAVATVEALKVVARAVAAMVAEMVMVMAA